ncbi:3-methyl-2-oxobutanoate hydroxymethyltransferase [bacterium (candidate division B38) B3_B38]|nr:MAG: 3-methyl-2-oxobutanoate hydroxymethyltransferase [bacterium (candidate division B38) B3_B38]
MRRGFSNSEKITIPKIAEKKRRDEKITMLTAYDYPMARIIDQIGVDIMLVGDSLANVILGYSNTLPVTMEEMLHHTKAVARGCQRALLVADMPYLSYHIDIKETIRNAGRFIKEGGAEAVKVEGGKKRAEVISRILDLEIPVMGHIGLTPQSIHQMGGYRVQGNTLDQSLTLVEEARLLEATGVFSIVLEGIPEEVAQIITQGVSIPTIGIGAGRFCDGQVLVVHDMLGFFEEFQPKFVRRYANLHQEIGKAVRQFFSDIREGKFPSEKESHHLPPEIAAALKEKLAKGNGDN